LSRGVGRAALGAHAGERRGHLRALAGAREGRRRRVAGAAQGEQCQREVELNRRSGGAACGNRASRRIWAFRPLKGFTALHRTGVACRTTVKRKGGWEGSHGVVGRSWSSEPRQGDSVATRNGHTATPSRANPNVGFAAAPWDGHGTAHLLPR